MITTTEREIISTIVSVMFTYFIIRDLNVKEAVGLEILIIFILAIIFYMCIFATTYFILTKLKIASEEKEDLI